MPARRKGLLRSAAAALGAGVLALAALTQTGKGHEPKPAPERPAQALQARERPAQPVAAAQKPAAQAAAQAPAQPTAVRTTTGVVRFPLSVTSGGRELVFNNYNSYRAHVEGLVARKARELGVSETLALAHLRQESGYNPFARSASGAHGLMQLKEIAVRDAQRLNDRYRLGLAALGNRPVNLYDLETNVHLGVAAIKVQKEHYARRLVRAGFSAGQLRDLGIAFYNAGPTGKPDRARRLLQNNRYLAGVRAHESEIVRERGNR